MRRAHRIRVQFLFQLATALLPTFCLLHPARADPPAPLNSPFAKSITSGSWVYQTLVRLAEHHIISPRDGTYPFLKGEPLSPYEAAFLIGTTLERSVPAAAHSGTIARMTPQNHRIFAEDITLLRQLMSEFSVELKTLGMDMPAAAQLLNHVEQDIRKTEPPFADIAPDHWASASVERLRQAGVLVGYHGGSFMADPFHAE